MAGKGVEAGKAFISVFLDDVKMLRALRRLQATMREVGTKLASIGAATSAAGAAMLAPFAGALKTFAGYGDQLDKMSGRTGVSVEALSQLGFAAEQSGQSLEVVEKGVKGMQKQLYELERGSTTAIDAFTDLGLTLTDLQGKSPEEQFTLIGDRISGIADPSKRAAVALKVFGRAGADLLPMFAGGADGISALRNEADALGLTMSTEDTKAAAAFTDALNRLWKQLRTVFMQLGAAIAGPLTTFMSYSQAVLRSVIDWATANRPLIAGVAGLGVALVAAGTAAAVLGTALALLGTPVGATVAAVVGGTAAFVKFTDTGRAMFEQLSAYFAGLRDIVMRSFEAISAALAAGDVEAAGRVLWAGLKLLFLQGTASLRETWRTTVGELAKAWHTAWAGVLQVYNYATSTIGNVWDRLVGGIAKAWASTVAFLEKTWLRIKGLFGSDVAAEIERVNAEVTAINRTIDEQTGASVAKRNAGYEENLANIGADLAGKLSATDDGTAAALAEAQRALDEAKAAFSQAETAALAAGTAAEMQIKAVDGAGQTPGAMAAAGSSAGTFSIAAIGSLLRGSGGPEEKTAKNTEEIARGVKDLNENVKAGGVFP